MTKKLEDIFNLDPEVKNAPVIKDEKAIHEQITSVDETYKAIEKMTTGLPQIQELNDIDDKELDNLASKAEQAYDDLMDLGMNVEVRYASRIFEVAGTMMKNAIDAKSAKIDKKLKAIDLQMKKYKIDRDANDDPNNVLNGEGYIITDRNDLLKKLGQKN